MCLACLFVSLHTRMSYILVVLKYLTSNIGWVINAPLVLWKSGSLYFLQWKPFKNDEKCFLFDLKRYFHSQDTDIFVFNFWSCRKNGLIRQIRLISKFKTSQPGQQTITIHTLPNISQSKDNQTMTFTQVVEYIKRNIFLK